MLSTAISVIILYFIIKGTYGSTLSTLSIMNSTECISNCLTEIEYCNSNSECSEIALNFDTYFANNSNNITIINMYQWYLDHCTDDGNYEYECTENYFRSYFDCTVMSQSPCYSPKYVSPCHQEFENCIGDTATYDNCLTFFDYTADFDNKNIMDDEWLNDVLIEEGMWDFTFLNPTDNGKYTKYISLMSCLYAQILLDNQTCSNAPADQCTLNGCSQQQNVMDCIFDINCGYPLIYYNGGSDIIGINNYIQNCESSRICNNDDIKSTLFNEDYAAFKTITNNFTSTFNNDLLPRITECSIPNISKTDTTNQCLNMECASQLSACNADFWDYIHLDPGHQTYSLCKDMNFCPGQCSSDFAAISNIQYQYGVTLCLFSSTLFQVPQLFIYHHSTVPLLAV